MNDHGARVYDSIQGLQSSEENPTPLVRLSRVVPFQNAAVYAKLEWYNPFGAVKDRIAANLVKDAEEKKSLGPGKRLVEPTSGNTGLALTMLGNARGYPLRVTVSSAVPLEKRAMLRFFGADLVELDDSLCPAPGAPEGAIAVAMSTAQSLPDFHMLNQYQNEANPDAHYRTTGPEIWRQTKGQVTHFVAAMGTCGTITGTGRFLKEKNPKVKVIGVHPKEGHDIPGVRSIEQLKQTRFFLPEQYDRLIEVQDSEAYDMCLRLNREESVIAGPSSGLALVGALKVVQDEPGAVVVVIFPDNAFKYASSFLRHFPKVFEGIKGAAPSAPSGAAQKDPLLQAMIANSRNPFDTVEVDEVQKRLNSPTPPLLIDVRAQDSYARGHLPGAKNIPVDEITGRASELPQDRDAPIVTVCQRGNASLPGMLVLKSLGYRNVKSLNGGTSAWAAQGLPVET
jgi:cysteine synthase/rhodanese-related sulfurtransferase